MSKAIEFLALVKNQHNVSLEPRWGFSYTNNIKLKVKRYLARIIITRYVKIDLGLAFLFLIIPYLMQPQALAYFLVRAILFSSFITPLVLYWELRKENSLPFFYNLRINPVFVLAAITVIKLLALWGVVTYG